MTSRLILPFLAFILFVFDQVCAQEQTFEFQFGTEMKSNDLLFSRDVDARPITWINVNTEKTTWAKERNELICHGNPIGVVRSAKMYENFMLHVEWKHMEAGGNSGIFVWSQAIPGKENRLPDGVEVQMLELDWVNLKTRNGKKPPIAYVHGELFGVGGVKIIPDNPRGERSKSIENRCKGRGEWNTYDVICVDGTIKLSVNDTFVNGISQSTQKLGYLCLEAEGAEIHFRNLKVVELPSGLAKAD
jgi:hypothetical protein